MSFSINTNAGALVALQNLNKTNSQLNSIQGRINTGLKVAGAKDDASIFAIAQKQRAELGGLNAVEASLNRAKGGLDVALAGAEAISDTLIQMKEKAVAAADEGNDDDSRALLNRDYQQLLQQIDTITENAEFNGKNMISATPDNMEAIIDADGSDKVTISGTDITTGGLLLAGFDISTQAQAAIEIPFIDSAIDIVNGVLSDLGAGAKRIEIIENFTDKLADTIEVGIGNLVDADMARESADLESLQVKQQLGLQALSIANQAPQAVTSLFNG